MQLKKSLFDGVFDAPTSEVSFAKLGRKSVLQQVKEIFANQPGRPEPIIDAPPPQPIPVGAAATTPAPPTEMAMEPSKVAEPVSIGSRLQPATRTESAPSKEPQSAWPRLD
jgi:hypothetical protein